MEKLSEPGEKSKSSYHHEFELDINSLDKKLIEEGTPVEKASSRSRQHAYFYFVPSRICTTTIDDVTDKRAKLQ